MYRIHQCALGALLVSLLVLGSALDCPAQDSKKDGLWSEKVWVDNGQEVCVVYQAAVYRDAVVVKFAHQKPWHSYSLDNEARAKKALAGKKSLGTEQSTAIAVKGAKVDEIWYQTKPTNFSKPDLLWFSWGYTGQGYFASKFDVDSYIATTAKQNRDLSVHITGQSCSKGTCLPIDVIINLSSKNFIDEEFDFQNLEIAKSVSKNQHDRASIGKKSEKKSIELNSEEPGRNAVKKEPVVESSWNQLSDSFAKDVTKKIWPSLADYSGEKGLSLEKILPDLKDVGFGFTDKQMVYSSYVAKGSAELLGQMDPNRDAWISKEEMESCIQKQIYERMEYRILQDVDGDGRVSPKEYSVSLRPGKQKVDKDGLTKRARSSFLRQDKNKNGFLDLNSEVFPNSSRDAGSQITRFSIALCLSRKMKSKGGLEEINFTQLGEWFPEADEKTRTKIWKGLQDSGRFGRRGRKPKKKKIYMAEIKRSSLSYRIAVAGSEVLKLMEENL